MIQEKRQSKQVMNRYKMKKYFKTILIYTLFAVISCLVLLPIIITMAASVKTTSMIGSTSPLVFPSFVDMTFENYQFIIDSGKLWIGARTSLILVIVSVGINAIIGSTTAYALERFEFKAKYLIYSLFVAGMLLPSFITEIARFKVISNLGLYNTIGAPLLIYIATDLMQLYIYRQFVQKIPISLDESAMMDGAGHFTVFWKIIFPNLLPATATLAIIRTVDIMNDMYVPYLYMPSAKLRTLTTMLMDFSGAYTGSWGTLSAAIVLVMMPTIILYLIFQRYIFAGIMKGAVKE